MEELKSEDITYFTNSLMQARSSLGRMVTISNMARLAQTYPNARPAFVRSFAFLLITSDEPPVAERLVQVLLKLRVKEAAEYIQIAFEKGLLAPDFLGGWEKVQTRLARLAPSQPVNLPSPYNNDIDEFWRALLLEPDSPSETPKPGRRRRRTKRS